MEIHKFILAGIAVLPVLLAANGMAETSPAKKPVPEKALTLPNPKESENVQAHSMPDHSPALTPLGAEKAGLLRLSLFVTKSHII